MPVSRHTLDHLRGQPFLEVDFPFGVVWVSLSLDLDVASDRHACSTEQTKFFPIQTAIKHPVAAVDGFEVFPLHPSLALVGVSSIRPAPDGLEHCVVDFREGVFANDVSMIMCPTSDDGIELCNE